MKLDKDYFADRIETSLYNRLSLDIQSKIESFEMKIIGQNKMIEKLSTYNDIDKEVVIATLVNFNQLFHKVDSEEKKNASSCVN